MRYLSTGLVALVLAFPVAAQETSLDDIKTLLVALAESEADDEREENIKAFIEARIAAKEKADADRAAVALALIEMKAESEKEINDLRQQLAAKEREANLAALKGILERCCPAEDAPVGVGAVPVQLVPVRAQRSPHSMGVDVGVRFGLLGRLFGGRSRGGGCL